MPSVRPGQADRPAASPARSTPDVGPNGPRPDQSIQSPLHLDHIDVALTRRTRLALCGLLGAVSLAAGYRAATTVAYPTVGVAKATAVATPLRLNPNHAPWWELTALPGVGEVTAKKIVDYRETYRREQGLPPEAPVFHSPRDLQRVKGIGPKKSAQMVDFLTFDPQNEPRRHGGAEAP